VKPRKSRKSSSSPWSALPGTADPTAPRTVYSLSEDETFELGRVFARRLRGGELILLEGELGLGKTVFARGLSAGLGISPEDVSSPSFTLVQEYVGGRLPVFHIDLYRLEEPDEMESLGLDEILTAGGVVMVEWGERLPMHYRREALSIRFHDVGEGSRRIELIPAPRAPKTGRGDA